MDNLEQMLQGVLSNPEMMQKIMGLAQSLGEAPERSPEDKGSPSESLPDSGALSRLPELMKKAGIDSKQQALLNALSPYLHGNRIQKLRRAMQAAKMAELTSSMLGNSKSGGR